MAAAAPPPRGFECRTGRTLSIVGGRGVAGDEEPLEGRGRVFSIHCQLDSRDLEERVRGKDDEGGGARGAVRGREDDEVTALMIRRRSSSSMATTYSSLSSNGIHSVVPDGS